MDRNSLLSAIRAAASPKKEEKEVKRAIVVDEEDDDPELIQVRLGGWIANPAFSDVTFVLEDGKVRIPAHRQILAARSPLFAAMLYREFGDDPLPAAQDIEIKGTDAASFQLVLQACYTDRPRINAKQIIPAITAAKKYMVDGLAEACLDFMRDGLSSENACDLFANAPKDERQFALTYIEIHANEVLGTESFMELAEDDICVIARSNNLSTDEMTLFKALLEWGTRRVRQSNNDSKEVVDQEALARVLRNPIQHVRFPLMTVEDLASTVAPSGALDQHSLVELFTYLSSTSRKKQIGRFCPFERTLHQASAAMKWDAKKSSLVNIHPDGLTVEPSSKTCARFKYAQTDIAFPKNGVFYWEIILSMSGGCYDSIGVVNGKYTPSQRLGMNANSWAVRVYGATGTTPDQVGAWHNNKNTDFFKGWAAGDRIGLLYDTRKSHLTYYRNGTFIGTPFTNVKGDIYPCVEMCHQGSMRANFRAQPPKKGAMVGP